MSDAQTWTLIAGFFTMLIASQALVLRLVRAEAHALRAEMRELVTSAIAPLVERMARLEAKVDGLDRDVQAVINRWGRGEV